MKISKVLENHQYHEAIVRLKRIDTDLVVELPGGGCITIQQRTENGSVDIIFHDNVMVYSHYGDHLEPARKPKKSPKHQVVHKAKQLVVFGLIKPDVTD